MFSTLRNRFGIPGVISVMALVFAMFGGAYAASNDSGGGKATASAKAKKGPRGPKGATGPAGPVGPAGPQGPAGAKGDAGANGSNGTAGAAGTTGQSVTSTIEPPGGNCEEGGAKFVASNGTTYACNGATGTQGPAGEPWTAGGTLPVGATETGTYAANGSYLSTLGIFAEISFDIPLADPLDSTHAVYVPGGEAANPDPTHCAGTPSEPTAASGYLCVYEGSSGAGLGSTVILNSTFSGFGAGISGALVRSTVTATEEAPEPVFSTGTYAVTG